MEAHPRVCRNLVLVEPSHDCGPYSHVASGRGSSDLPKEGDDEVSVKESTFLKRFW